MTPLPALLGARFTANCDTLLKQLNRHTTGINWYEYELTQYELMCDLKEARYRAVLTHVHIHA